MMIKRLLRPPYRFLRTVLKLNIIATLRVNFSLLSLREAIKFPVYVYGKTFIHSLKGKIVFNSPIHSGMLRLGFKYVDLHPLSFTSNVLWIDGTVKCCGVVLFAGGVNLLVPREEAVIEMGEKCPDWKRHEIMCPQGYQDWSLYADNDELYGYGY